MCCSTPIPDVKALPILNVNSKPAQDLPGKGTIHWISKGINDFLHQDLILLIRDASNPCTAGNADDVPRILEDSPSHTQAR